MVLVDETFAKKCVVVGIVIVFRHELLILVHHSFQLVGFKIVYQDDLVVVVVVVLFVCVETHIYLFLGLVQPCCYILVVVVDGWYKIGEKGING